MNFFRRSSSESIVSPTSAQFVSSNSPSKPATKEPQLTVGLSKDPNNKGGRIGAKQSADKIADKRFGERKTLVNRLVSPFKGPSPSKAASKLGMLLHVYVGDAQLESPPKDKLQLRLVLSGDVKQGGRNFSIVSSWKEGALVSFKHTQVMGAADDKGTSTIHFSLRGTMKDKPAEEEIMGEAVLSTYAMESAIEKVIVLNPPPGGTKSSKSNAPVGRMSVTMFLNRFAIDFNAEAHNSKSLVMSAGGGGGGGAAGGGTATAAKPSSREYAFLLNRKLNWKGDGRVSSFNKQTEKLLQEDMSKHMKELRRSVQAVNTTMRIGGSRAANVNSNASARKTPRALGAAGAARSPSPEPKLAYGTRHPPPPPRAQSPTRRTNMGVGFIGASWPKPPKPVPTEDEEKLAFQLQMA